MKKWLRFHLVFFKTIIFDAYLVYLQKLIGITYALLAELDTHLLTKKAESMLRFKSEKTHSSNLQLANVFLLNTKEELKNIAHVMFFSISSSFRKADYAKALSANVLCYSSGWMKRLPKHELLILKRLVEAGPNSYIEIDTSPTPMLLEVFCLVWRDPLEDGQKTRLMICDELRESVAKHLETILSSGQREAYWEIEQHACGLLNLYGLLPYADMVEMLSDLLKSKYTFDNICSCLSESILIKFLTFQMIDDLETRLYIRSKALSEDIEYVDQHMRDYEEIKSRKSFSLEEICQAGAMPFFRIPNPHEAESRTFLTVDLKYTDVDVEKVLYDLWYCRQVDKDLMSLLVGLMTKKGSSVTLLQKGIGILTKYYNHLPSWIFKGYSSSEFSKKFEKNKFMNKPPQVMLDPRLESTDMAMNQKRQAPFNGFFTDQLSERKVGRNEPCPCGSGKKYKHCCGRN